MPNRDKTGPTGDAPMTGRKMGSCVGAYGPGTGMGRGYGRAMCGWFNRQYQAMPKQERREILEQEIEDLKAELEMIQTELKELEK
jgi:hypothetical protein